MNSMAYKRKPDTAKDDLIKSNILYEAQIWPERQGWGTLPNREVFEALVRAKCTNPGPLVIDIEHISIGGSPGAPHHNVPMLAQLADWAHEAVPGKVVGYYGTNTLSGIPQAEHTLALELSSHVDAFFTPIYNFDDIRANWEKRAGRPGRSACARREEAHLLFPLAAVLRGFGESASLRHR